MAFDFRLLTIDPLLFSYSKSLIFPNYLLRGKGQAVKFVYLVLYLPAGLSAYQTGKLAAEIILRHADKFSLI